jgi:predicted acylesterase/phospholipase RssA
VITPDSPDRVYSTRLRTALVLTGSGTGGAYHAGVLSALHEAGVKIDLVCGRGIGVVSAVFAAIDGGARLWEPHGVWRGPHASGYYRWRAALRAAGWAIVGAAVVLAVPVGVLALAVVLAMSVFKPKGDS